MKYFLSYAVLLFFIALTGCKKENGGDNPTLVQGKIRLQVTAMHHSWAVTGIRIYLKKEATEWPGPDSTLYETYATTDKGGNVVFENLFRGNYFVYASGYDQVFRAMVYGYAPLKLDHSTVTNNESNLTLYVNEK